MSEVPQPLDDGNSGSTRGDTSAYWFRAQDACFEAITAEVFFHWSSGQSDGPDNLPATAAGLPAPGLETQLRLDELKNHSSCPAAHPPGHGEGTANIR
jgi:hypothetical protein